MIKIKLGKHAGFCFGVKRAVNLALQTAEQHKGKQISTVGPLIHNPQVIADLRAKGIKNVADLSKIKSGIMIVCSHGMHPEALAKLKEKNLIIIDATCPFVKKIETIICRLKDSKEAIIIVGDKRHPEIKALSGYAGKKAKIVENATEAKKLGHLENAIAVAQTTQSIEKYKKICQILKLKTNDLEVYHTICDSTAKRQREALRVARQVEKILVVGGHNSANTKRLAQLCRDLGKPVLHIEEARQLARDFLIGTNSIGILAGASTPDWIIKEVISKIKKWRDNSYHGNGK